MTAYEDGIDYYAVLNVPKDADSRQIRLSYKKLIRENHPDVKKQEYNSDLYKNILKAYTILKDIKSRNEYDRHMRQNGTFKRSIGFSFSYESLIERTRHFFSRISLYFVNVESRSHSVPGREDDRFYDTEYASNMCESLLSMNTAELLQRLIYSDNKYVRQNAIVVLACKQEQKLEELLDGLLEHVDITIRRAAIWAVGKMKLKSKARYLKEKFYLYSPREQLGIVKALSHISGGSDSSLTGFIQTIAEKSFESIQALNEIEEYYGRGAKSVG